MDQLDGSRPVWTEMDQMSEVDRSGPIGLNTTQVDRNGPKWTKLDRSGAIGLKWTEVTTWTELDWLDLSRPIGPNGRSGPIGLNWTDMTKWTNWTELDLSGQKWTK